MNTLLAYEKFSLAAALLLIPTSLLQTAVRITSCTYLGLEPITADWVFGRVVCDVMPVEYYPLVLSVENGVIFAAFAAPIFIKWVQRRRYLQTALFVAMVFQGAHMVIDMFAYEVDEIVDPLYLVLAGYLLVAWLVARHMCQKISLRGTRA